MISTISGYYPSYSGYMIDDIWLTLLIPTWITGDFLPSDDAPGRDPSCQNLLALESPGVPWWMDIRPWWNWQMGPKWHVVTRIGSTGNSPGGRDWQGFMGLPLEKKFPEFPEFPYILTKWSHTFWEHDIWGLHSKRVSLSLCLSLVCQTLKAEWGWFHLTTRKRPRDIEKTIMQTYMTYHPIV